VKSVALKRLPHRPENQNRFSESTMRRYAGIKS
jgi:hypothetical protein